MIRFTGPMDFCFEITEQRMYSDGTPMIKTGEQEFADIVVGADSMTVQAGSMTEFVNAMFLHDAITNAGNYISSLILPYIPGARQDRSNPTGDVLFTLDSVAKMINARYFNDVVVLDPHSPVSMELINSITAYPLKYVAAKMWQGYSGVIAPDKGAKDRAEQFAAVMKKPIYYGSKTRDVSTGRLSGFEIEVPAQGHYLVVDDICDGGGTFVGLGERLAAQGAYADLYVSHGIFSKGTGDLRKYYKNIYTTDSRELTHSEGVHVVPVVKDMENY